MLQSFKLAIKSIWGNKMRSFLTMLGIIIGVAAVIILVSLVNGYMGSVVESFASMGVNQINVNMTNLTSRTVDVEQMYAFYDEHGDLFDGISPNVSLSATVKKGDDSMSSTSVAGRSEQYLDMKDYDLQLGRNIAYSDIASRQKVCVIGSYVAQELFGSAEKAINETLKINGYAFKVVGIVETQDEDNMDADVKGIISFYGANSMMLPDGTPSTLNHHLPDSPEGKEMGGVNLREHPELCRKMSVECNVDEQTKLPPVLMFHGTKDKTINPRVSVTVYNRLKQCGKDVKLYFLEGADHGGSEFWTEEVQRIVMEFMNKV